MALEQSGNPQMATAEAIQFNKLHKIDVMGRALSDFTDRFPQIQSLAKDYYSGMSEMQSKSAQIKSKLNVLMGDVVKEYRSRAKLGVLGKAFDYMFSGFADESAYFKEMWDESTGNFIKPENAINEEQKKFLTFIQDFTNEQWVKDILRKSNRKITEREWGLHMAPDSLEVYHQSGFYEALKKFLGSNKYVEETKISVINPENDKRELMTLANYLHALQSDYVGKKNIMTAAERNAKATKAILHAKKRHDTRHHDNINGGEGDEMGAEELASTYKIGDAGLAIVQPLTDAGSRALSRDLNLQSSWHFKPNENTPYTRNIYRAFTRFADDMLFERYMNGFIDEKEVEHPPILQKLLALQSHYGLLAKTDDGHNDTVNYLKYFMEGRILGIRQPGEFGRTADNLWNSAFTWTFYANMAFNIPMSIMNVAVGTINNLIFGKTKSMIKGNERYFATRGYIPFQKSALRAILEEHKVVNYDDKFEGIPTFKNHFTKLSMHLVEKGEEYIQGSMFLGRIPDDVWANISKEGPNIGKYIDENGPTLSQKDYIAIKKDISDIQGKYWERDKRNYSLFAGYRLVGQFKTWLPDTIRMWWMAEETNFTGKKNKGIMRTFINHFTNVIHDAHELGFSGSVKKEFGRFSFGDDSDPDVVNMRRELKAALIFGALYCTYAMAHGDDEDKELAEKIQSLMKQVATVFDVSNLSSWFIAPATDTLKKFGLFAEALLTMKTYENDSRGGKQGESMVPYKLTGLLPYGHLVKPFVENEDYGKK